MATSGEDVKGLMKRKDAIEVEIKELLSVLDSQQGVGMHEHVVDEEQYPRVDIDINTVRNARQRVICLQNDHKDIMKEIEQGLHKLHAETREEQEKQEEEDMDSQPSTSTASSRGGTETFAKVDRVDPGSPAALGGVQVGDELVKFGSLSARNFQGMQNLTTVVQHGKGRPLAVTVCRDGEEVQMAITPRAWSGKGLLGCNMVPIKTSTEV